MVIWCYIFAKNQLKHSNPLQNYKKKSIFAIPRLHFLEKNEGLTILVPQKYTIYVKKCTFYIH